MARAKLDREQQTARQIGALTRIPHRSVCQIPDDKPYAYPQAQQRPSAHTRVHASRRVHAPPRPPYAHAHSTYARAHTHNHTQPHPSTLSLAHSLKRVCTNPYTTLCWLYGEWGWACAI
jgi:hypothetical protein